jgi:hypothetical protein
MSTTTEAIHLHAAVFAANRAAKQTRDPSRRRYLYDLKERGVAFLFKNGRLDIRAHGGMFVYRGEGYAFHLDECFAEDRVEVSNAPSNQEFIGVKPKGSFCTLDDALRELEALPTVEQLFVSSDSIETDGPRQP